MMKVVFFFIILFIIAATKKCSIMPVKLEMIETLIHASLILYFFSKLFQSSFVDEDLQYTS